MYRLHEPSAAFTNRTGTERAQAPDREFVGRQQQLKDISAAVTAGGSAGAVLVGGPGIGKTALMQQALKQLGPGFHVVQVRGSVFSAKLPYGALSVLLAELGSDVDQHPVFLIGALAGLLKKQAEGRAVLFAVDNAEHLDSFSTTVLNHLILDGTARLILTSRDFSQAPDDLIGLWREGTLRRLDIGPLAYGEARECLKSALGGRISRTAVDALWESSGGNPLYLRTGCYDLQDAHRLVLQDDVWVLDAGEVEPGRHTSDALLGNLSSLTPAQTGVLEILSLAGSLALPLLLRIGEAADVDLLQESGLVSVDQSPPPSVHVTDSLLRRTLAAKISIGRRSTLYEKLLAAVEAGAEPPLDQLASAEWIISFGGTLPPKTALAAAKLARRRSNSALALDLLRSSHGAITAALVVETVAALTTMGDYAGAERELETYWAESSAPPPLGDWVHLKLAESRLRQRSGHPGAARPLEEVESRIQRSSVLPQHAPLCDELAIAQAELASYEGRFSDSASVLSKIYRSRTNGDINFRVQVGSWLCEAWAMTDRQHEARELAGELLLTLLADSQLSPQSTEIMYERAAMAYYMTGGWTEYRRTVRASAVLDIGAGFQAGAAAELADGLGYAHIGQTESALECLIPAVSQFRRSDPAGLLPLAAAAAAFCYAREGNVQQAQLLLHYRSELKGGSWKIRRDAAHFAALATALTYSRQRAVESLRAMCDQDRRLGTAAYELIGLCSAVRLGDKSAINRLSTVAANVQGSFAELCETYAKGLGNQDCLVLLQAMEMANEAGDHVFAREVGEEALQVASSAGDRAGVRHVQRSMRAAFAGVPDHGAGERPLEVLTSRELEIAGRASQGISNKAMAEEMCVSVRTIEGHLYRVYAKLCVDNRAELSAVLAMESAAS